ncbi:MAG: hypothetical protein ACOYK8_10145 [Alphaproteobacteria bacterium]
MTYGKRLKVPAVSGKVADHVVGSAVGAAMGAVTCGVVVGAAEGAAVGTLAGLPGIIAGAAIGGIAGALAGKELAHLINPTKEETYWRDNHENRAYFDSITSYDSYAPAYRFGIEAYFTYPARNFDEIEPQLSQQWDGARGNSRLTWDSAKLAARDAYERLCNSKD